MTTVSAPVPAPAPARPGPLASAAGGAFTPRARASTASRERPKGDLVLERLCRDGVTAAVHDPARGWGVDERAAELDGAAVGEDAVGYGFVVDVGTHLEVGDLQGDAAVNGEVGRRAP